MKNLVKIVLVLCLSLGLAACKKQTKQSGDDMMMDENLAAPTTVDVTVEDTAPVVVDVQNTEVALRQVNFALDRYNLSDTAKKILADNAQLIKAKGSNANVTVEGHCDERGTIAYNIALGDKRATEVRKYYGRLGLNTANITTVSYGEEKPLCFEQTESCYSKNRRAETLVSVK
ncbi:MAG: OmpA family protein [Elusimicrobium sp.]|jgi:peptidoglycan-associated lipoprotein|nr:OmpA family protein [Elusimicrobium sp.]